MRFYDDFFSQSLHRLREEGRYRIFTCLERESDRAPYAQWIHEGKKENVVVWCSNDYLGMSHHPAVKQAFIEGVERYGVGSGGTRNIAGTSSAHTQLEKKIASFHQKDNALLFSSGYTANEGALSSLASGLPECIVLSDEKNHASIIQGIRSSRAHKIIFRHNDLMDLKQKLSQFPLSHPKIVVVTSVYSMEGDLAPLPEILSLCDTFQALSYVDEVHAVGLYGPRGGGVLSHYGLEDQVDVIQGNFAKGFGVVGGYIAGSHALVDFVRSMASGFIFTTSLPPAVALAARRSLEMVEQDCTLRDRFWERVQSFKDKLAQTQLPYRFSNSHIIHLPVGNAHYCRALTDSLLRDYKIYIQPINYPTVPVGSECLRLTVTPFHTDAHMDQLIEALTALWKKDFEPEEVLFGKVA